MTCLLIAGCATTIPPASLATPQRLQPIQSTAEDSQSIFIANVVVKLIDKKIGQMKGGTLCLGGVDLVWQDNQGVVNAMREQMSATLLKQGYRVSSGLIPVNNERNADILIGAAIEDVKANICYSVDGMKGAASLTLRWEILDNKTKKSTVLTAVGASSIDQFSKTGDPDVFVKAVEMATENLLAQDAFFKATRR
jgi:hypothetical protein